jgi:hypothetical protein
VKFDRYCCRILGKITHSFRFRQLELLWTFWNIQASHLSGRQASTRLRLTFPSSPSASPSSNISASTSLKQIHFKLTSHETVQNVPTSPLSHASPSNIPQGKSNLHNLLSHLHPLLHTTLQTLPRLLNRALPPNTNPPNPAAIQPFHCLLKTRTNTRC